ncbi:hypothetical protein C6341_g14123 [Phytophthora cactorum]|nr:hypothetical protein C6341_g14123 [Phytophthora cactorum]
MFIGKTASDQEGSQRMSRRGASPIEQATEPATGPACRRGVLLAAFSHFHFGSVNLAALATGEQRWMAARLRVEPQVEACDAATTAGECGDLGVELPSLNAPKLQQISLLTG